MRLQPREARPPVSAERLAAAERKLAELVRSIPPSYRELLADQDGGRPVLDCYDFERDGEQWSSRVKVFLGVGPDPDGSLVKTAGLIMDLPEGVLAIAPDDTGNLLCMRDDGSLVWWFHEEEDLSDVAPDLQTFLDALHEEPAPPPQPQRG